MTRADSMYVNRPNTDMENPPGRAGSWQLNLGMWKLAGGIGSSFMNYEFEMLVFE